MYNLFSSKIVLVLSILEFYHLCNTYTYKVHFYRNNIEGAHNICSSCGQSNIPEAVDLAIPNKLAFDILDFRSRTYILSTVDLFLPTTLLRNFDLCIYIQPTQFLN